MGHCFRFAIVGCGRVAEKYFHHLVVDPIRNGRISAVCDIDKERAQAAGQKYNVPWFDSIEALIEKKRNSVDVVIVLTPSGLHAEQVISLAPYGKHIVVEKPMALTLESADRVRVGTRDERNECR